MKKKKARNKKPEAPQCPQVIFHEEPSQGRFLRTCGTHPTTDPRVNAGGMPITARITKAATAIIISVVETKTVPCVLFVLRRNLFQTNRGKNLT